MSHAAIAFDTSFRSKVREYATQQWTEIKLLRKASAWVPACLEKISEYAQLPQNWDSYGSDPISGEAIKTALRFLAEGPMELVPEPSVSPVPGGGLGFHWRVDSRDLELEFLPNGTIKSLKTRRPGSGEIETEEGEVQSLRDPKLWDWLCGE